MLSTGQLLADRYRLSRRIAVGGMGEVWAAQDARLDRNVAIKVLKAELSGDPEFLHRFRTEARTTASLNHPGIAAVHDYGETASVPDGPEDTAYLVMELVEGEPLAALVAKHGRLSVEFTLDVLEQSAAALQAAHENGLVHRDVKPGNILIVARPGGEIAVKLTDFGIAKAAHAAPVTRSGMVMGTAHYIAPEQATGSEAGPASDVYSLAVCGYECLVGHRPFLSDHAVTVAMQHIRDTPPPLPPDIPPPVRALIDIAMAKDPRQRYGSGGEFAHAVSVVRAGGTPPPPQGYGMAPTQMLTNGAPLGPVMTNPGMTPAAGYPPPPPYPPQRRGGTGWVWVLLVIALIALIAIGALVLTSQNGDRAPAGGGAPSQTTAPTTQQATPPQQPTTTTTTTTTTTETTTTTSTVSIDSADYEGRAASDAVNDLTAKGLRPKVITESGATPSDPDVCIVHGVHPDGDVPEGAHIVVTCAPDGGGTG